MTSTLDVQSPRRGPAAAGPWLVRDVMTTDVVAVDADTPYRELVKLLTSHAVSAVPVLDTDRRVLGVVSEADLLNKLEFSGLDVHRQLLIGRRRTGRVKSSAATAAGLMTEPPVVIRANASISAAASLMDRERVKRLPVVDAHGVLVGIVSRTDLLRVYRRGDHDLREEVVGPVLRRTLGIAPGTLEVTVAGGVVTLGGAVGRRSTIPIVVRLVQGVPGVIGVVDHLSYRYDDRHQ
jgi:CBS domain-containing protein